MTLHVYAGLFDDDLDGIADRMDAIGRAAVAQSWPTADVITLSDSRRRSAAQ